MKLLQLLSDQPMPKTISEARREICELLKRSNKRLVVIDDDPTGTQTVHGVRVYMEWSVETLRRAFESGESVFYISTNSRALPVEQVEHLCLELGKNIRDAAGGADVILASRSDSTLRGHFPHEVDALLKGLGQEVDGIIIAPAFFEAGRYTIDDIHYVDQGGEMVLAHETEFAKDPTFGYTKSNLREWVEEKTGGRIKAENVISISLETIRVGGNEAVAEVLMRAKNAIPVVINATCYDDLDVVAMGLSIAEGRGQKFAYRCAACLVKTRGGIEDCELLTRAEISPKDAPGLVVAGSYVGTTSRQLEELLASGLADGIELNVDDLLAANSRVKEINRVTECVDGKLAAGRSAAVYTSRTRYMADKDQFLEIGSVIMCSLCSVVSNMSVNPGFLVAKGGITSIEVARTGLEVKEALVMGQILAGIPVWQLGKGSKWSGMPYIVFPGNVGDDYSLRDVVQILQTK